LRRKVESGCRTWVAGQRRTSQAAPDAPVPGCPQIRRERSEKDRHRELGSRRSASARAGVDPYRLIVNRMFEAVSWD